MGPDPIVLDGCIVFIVALIDRSPVVVPAQFESSILRRDGFRRGWPIPQATWTVQAIRTADEEKVLEGEMNRSQVCLPGPPKYDRLLRELNDCG